MLYKKFYAASNSAYGFKSYFEELFFAKEIKRRYLIKGGAGTGKSTLMKELAKRADKEGHDVEVYLCSSDVKSVDGVIIRDMGVCIFDATAPHAYDCRYLGCVDKLADVTQFLDADKLILHKDRIIQLTGKSKENYSKGYAFLFCAGKFALDIYESAKEHIESKEIEKLAKRLTKKCKKEPLVIKKRVATSISGKGKKSEKDFLKCVKKAYYIDEQYGIFPYLAEKIKEYASGNVIEFKSPLLPELTEGLYLEDTGVFISGEKNLLPEIYTKISTKKLHDGYFIENKAKLRFERKAVDEFMSIACDNFCLAAKSHDELEKINISAMDFDKMNKWSDKLIEEILRES